MLWVFIQSASLRLPGMIKGNSYASKGPESICSSSQMGKEETEKKRGMGVQRMSINII